MGETYNPSLMLCQSCFLAMAIVVAGGSAFGQSTAARISGTVFDEQHAAVPDAMVTARNLATGQIHSTASGPDGSYRLIGLAPGSYEIRIERSGFGTVVRSLDVTVSEDVDL